MRQRSLPLGAGERTAGDVACVARPGCHANVPHVAAAIVDDRQLAALVDEAGGDQGAGASGRSPPIARLDAMSQSRAAPSADVVASRRASGLRSAVRTAPEADSGWPTGLQVCVS